MTLRIIRIFISSPGDVQEERDIARGVIQQLGRTFAGRLQLQPVLWEELALGADKSFQKGIDLKLSELNLDIAVFILWSRLGSATEPLVLGDQVKPFRSGTEREWYLMLQAREDCVKRGVTPRPDILVYTRNDDVSFEERLRGKTDESKAADVQQKLNLTQFVKEEFHDTESGVNVRAYHNFDQPTTFAKQLRTHLTNLLESTYGVELDRPYWDVDVLGPPFRGLDVFEFEHAPIFFGREDELVAIRNRLRDQACRGCAFLLISGASGSGKSSLARAGVLPDIVTHEVDGDISKWRWCVLKPNQLGDDLLAGLVRSLLAKDVLPELENWNDDLTLPVDSNRMQEWSTRFTLRVKDALNTCANKRGATRLLVLVDQMEELFSNTSQTSESIQQFFEVLEDLARSGLVWIIATVRSDFYHECQKVPALVRMKDGAGQFDLVAPTSDSLMRVVTGPARLAGLRFEKSGEQSLADAIIRESAGCAELLPLVEYLMLDLFNHKTDDGVLTFAKYQELGGLEGALRTNCEDTYKELTSEAQAALPAVLSKLVTLSGDDLNTAVRRVVPWERIEANPAELELVSAMIAQRLFSTFSDTDGTKVVSVTHEAVLRIWPRVSEWTDQNRGFLRIRSRVEQSQSRWKQQPDNSLLLADGVPLTEGEQLLAEASHLLDSETEKYITQSIAYHAANKRKRRNLLIGIGTLTAILLIGVSWIGWRFSKQSQAEGIVKSIVLAKPSELERLIEKELPSHRAIADGLLKTISEENSDPSAKPGLHARLALRPIDSLSLASLQQAIVSIPEPDYLALIVRALKADKLTPDLWTQFHDATGDADKRFRAGLALASLAPESPQWTEQDAKFLVERLVQANPIHQSIYFELLLPISERLIEPLRIVFASETSGQVQQIASANAIAAFTKNRPDMLIEFLISATSEQYNILYPGFDRSETSKATLLKIVRTQPDEKLLQAQRIELGIRRAGAAITLLKQGVREEIFDVFRVTDDPESLSQFVARCKARGTTAAQLIECVDACEVNRASLTGNDRTLEDRVLHGLLLALGDYERESIPEAKREPLKTQLVTWYGTDPSSTVHGASGWLLRRWGYADEALKIDQTPIAYDPSGKRDWFTLEVNVASKAKKEQSLYFTFIVFPPGEYKLGAPTDEAKRQKDEAEHSVTLSRPFAVCDRELTWTQHGPFDDGQLRIAVETHIDRKLGPEHPVFAVNWYGAITYCRWLSTQMGDDDAPQCYDDPADLDQDEEGNPKYSNFYPERGGFRLPTEAEWEVFCRSGVRSAYAFGDDARLLDSYAWYQTNSAEWSHATAELKPNLRGLHDVHGNMLEWCHDWYTSEVEDGRVDPVGAAKGSVRVDRGGCWDYSAAICRSAYRFTFAPSFRNNSMGFRLVLSPSSGQDKKSSGKGAEPEDVGTEGVAEQRPEMP
jgi:formylglycine-generating enzyme required for sulfatase activity